ncbi:MAG: PQQ-binding-like beta-propeller repeat protein [Planctomycetota bacterium]|nr:PQQ-binding-like beta-propeller repeat protein [Planctomycetota bacterium]
MRICTRQRSCLGLAVAAWVFVSLMSLVPCTGRADNEPPLAQLITETYGVKGGLCAQLGGDDVALADALARTGKFLVQRLATNPAAVTTARDLLQAQGVYGLIAVDGLPAAGSLPFTENLVNVLILEQQPTPPLSLSEAARVLCPRGVLLAAGQPFSVDALRAAGFEELRTLESGGKTWSAGRKRWPAEMDQWSHPRHAADGNAVSQDLLVGPPRRVRWVTGPEQEVSSLVSGQGRNYYGGVWTRDAFNGLRLWQRELKPSPAQGGFGFSKAAGSVRPIAAGGLLFVWSESSLVALDGATGQPVRSYPEAGTPGEILHVGNLLLAVDSQSVRAVDVDSGRLCWKCEASEPRCVVADASSVFWLEGSPRRGEKCVAVSLDAATGSVRWRKADYPWLALVRRTVCHRDWLACEVSTLADEKLGNAIHVVSVADGSLLWSRSYVPHSSHYKQARGMFIGDLLWVLEDKQCVGLAPQTGEVKQTWPAGLCHCFPPVATLRYIFSGEMELTNLANGQYDANRLTKAACGRDAGWVPANGLIYVSPKHCVCWPMLRGYVAMAPAKQESQVAASPPSAGPASPPAPTGAGAGSASALEKGSASPPESVSAAGDDWPCYRHDAWRSSSTASVVPHDLRVLWKASFGGWLAGPIADDWRENPFVRGPITAPVVAGGLAYVARPDAHQLVALDVRTGEVRWRYTSNGRIDTAPTLHRGLCLFGTKNGWVYGLRADDGRLVWRLRAAPHEERIVAYGQIESPWPVAGSVLIADGVAYFAAGRQSLADGGILVFAVEPTTGQTRWVKRLDTVPTKNFYSCNGLEFDNIDLLHQEDDGVAMSRWLFRRDTGDMTCKATDAFAVFRTDSLDVVVPRGCWTYAPRQIARHGGDKSSVRPLVTFRGNSLLGCQDDLRTVYRRDFNLLGREEFSTTWITGWAASENFGKRTGEVWRSDRLAKHAKWSVPAFQATEPDQKIAALVLAGEQLLAAGSQGGLTRLSAENGQVLARNELPAPVWDGMAAAAGRVFVSTLDGEVVCLGTAER